MKLGTQKWQLVVYPKGQRRSVRDERGVNHSTALWARDYLDEQAPDRAERAAYRAAAQLRRRFPEDTFEIQPWTWRGANWGGDSRDRITLRWCPGCGGLLQ